MVNVPVLSLQEMALRLALAALLGALVGAEREWRDRTAGLRTHMLVCIGSAAFTIVSAYGFSEWYQHFEPGTRTGIVSDPTRIAAQIVSGIGFLGAGAIFRSDDGVRGLTTAASLWVMAAIGMAAGAGQYEVSIATTIIILLVLVALRQVSGRLNRMSRGERTPIVVLVSGASAIGDVLDRVAGASGNISNFQATMRRRSNHGRRLTFDLELPEHESLTDLVGKLALLDGVESVSARELPSTSSE